MYTIGDIGTMETGVQIYIPRLDPRFIGSVTLYKLFILSKFLSYAQQLEWW